MFLSFWLLCALAQHSVTGLNVCQEADLHIIITVDCNYPPNHWDMIPNMLNMLDDRATGEPLTTMIDLSSWSNVTLNNSSVENVYKMCNNLNKSEEELSSTNILKLQELMKTNNTTKHLYINILQDSKYSSWASLIENIHFKSYNMLNIIISKTDQIQSFQTEKSIFIAKNDKLENNNLISYLLCQKCKKNWYPKMVNGIMKSCFLFERKEEPMNWSHAASSSARVPKLTDSNACPEQVFATTFMTALTTATKPTAAHAPSTAVHPMFAYHVIGCSAVIW
ncbi:hypothetical protein BgiBS90_027095 [Biomphalaria glabrata]|nr:hypothetical protein BgiBS90_027095 [Biomphalaria glabrata]